MCIPAQTDLQWVASSLDLPASYYLAHLSTLPRESLVVFLVFRLIHSLAFITISLEASIPRTSKLFSGSLFPLEMLSSMGFHISSLSVSLLPGRSLLPGVRVENPEARRALVIAEAGDAAELRCLQCSI